MQLGPFPPGTQLTRLQLSTAAPARDGRWVGTTHGITLVVFRANQAERHVAVGKYRAAFKWPLTSSQCGMFPPARHVVLGLRQPGREDLQGFDIAVSRRQVNVQ